TAIRILAPRTTKAKSGVIFSPGRGMTTQTLLFTWRSTTELQSSLATGMFLRMRTLPALAVLIIGQVTLPAASTVSFLLLAFVLLLAAPARPRSARTRLPIQLHPGLFMFHSLAVMKSCLTLLS